MARNLDDLAQEAVTNFIRKSVPLNDTIKEIAERHELNEEEVKRVVGKTNTGAMLHMLANSADKKQEFPLADYKLQVSETEVATDTTTTHLPDFRTNYDVEFDLADPTSEEEKTAEEHIGLKEYFTWKIEKERIGHTKVATEMKVYDGVDYFVSEFSRYDAPDFQKWASEVYTIYGPASEPILESIATGLREDIGFIKCAHVINDTGKYFNKFAELYGSVKTLVAMHDREAVVRRNISEFEHAYL